MVAAHAPVLVGHVAPNREHVQDVLVVVGKHGHDDVPVLIRLEQRQERMLSPVGVPEGEDRVVGEAFRFVDLMVKTPVGAVHVHVDRGVDHRVVKGGVEHLLLGVRTLYLHLAQLFLPGLVGLGGDLVEGLSGRFRLEVLHRSSRSG